MADAVELLTVGYGRCPATKRWDRFVAALREAQVEWLFAWWERIDEWIASRKSVSRDHEGFSVP